MTRIGDGRQPDYDVIVIGGGPAGLSAATWAARYRRSVLVLDSGEYRNRWTEQAHGYLGSDPGDPRDLLERARQDLAKYPEVMLLPERAILAQRDTDGRFLVRTEASEHAGHRLILATGVVDEFPEVRGFYDHYGSSVFHCVTCDGYEASDRSVVVLGWGEHIAGFALGLLDWARDITVVTDGRPFEGDEHHRRLLADHGIAIHDDEVVEFRGSRGDLRGVRLRQGPVLEADLVFFSLGHRTRLELAEQLGCEVNDDGCLRVDRDGLTSLEGCYAAGDNTPGFQLVAVAVGKGAAAGVACAISLHGEAGAPDSPAPAPEPRSESV